MTEFSQFQFKENVYHPQSQIGQVDDRDEWEEQLQDVVEELMPFKKYKRVMLFSGFMTVYFLLSAMIVHILQSQIIEIIIDYENNCPVRGRKCQSKFSIEQNIEPPIIIYYEIGNLLQNQQVMYNSVDRNQLQGKIDGQSLSCGDYRTNQQMEKHFSLNGNPLSPDAIAIPCGLMAYSYFNDTISIQSKNKSIEIKQTELVSSIEKETYYKNNKDYLNNSWLDVENEHFMIWMKPSAITPFRKTWGRIDQVMEAGNYQVEINNEYDSFKFGINKQFVLLKTNSLGYKKPVFVITHYILGGINLIIFVYAVIQYFKFWKEKKEHVA